MVACTLIDDDLSVCDQELVINYHLQLHTTLSVQLQTELSGEPDGPVREALERYLGPVFTDMAKDVDLRFYNEETDDLRYGIQEEINDSRTTYTIRLPKENYMHLGVANMADNARVQLSGGDHSRSMLIHPTDQDEVGAMRTGLFTARMPMSVTDSTKSFDVHLYMVNAAVALILDTESCADLESLDGYLTGAAYAFLIRDSIYSYGNSYRTLMESLAVSKDRLAFRGERLADSTVPACLATVCMPTEDEQSWTLTVRATLTEDRHTTTTLLVPESLQAGSLRIIRCMVNSDGKIVPDEGEHAQEIGTAFELDWGEGTEQEIEL